MRAKLITRRWEENTAGWSVERRDAIKYARSVLDESGAELEHYACYKRGQIIEGESAIALVAAGVADEVIE